jgi:B-box zinc finger
MNCVNHGEVAATAWCQDCGKALCAQCTRTVGGNVYCEPCLMARTTAASAAGAPGAAGPQGPYAPGFAPAAVPNPGTAAILGFIPGVGAMYNGQYIKALVHVLVFVVLVGISEHYGLFGIFLAAWVIYQVFDAHQTAKARRDGLPLPDPFGLNELGNAIGGHPGARPYAPPPPAPPSGTTAGTGPAAAPGAVPPGNPAYADWAEQVRQQAHAFGQQTAEWGEQLRQRIVAETQARPFTPWNPPGAAPGVAPGVAPGAGYTQPPPGWGPPPSVPSVPPVPPQMELERARREPIGAIILILLGMLFLFNTMGFFSFHWVSHGWPLIIVAIAVWLIVRNTSGRYGPWGSRMGPPPPPPPVPPVEPPHAAAGATQEPPAGGGQ